LDVGGNKLFTVILTLKGTYIITLVVEELAGTVNVYKRTLFAVFE
jgi:hypothetical protein